MTRATQPDLIKLVIPTSDGSFVARYSEAGLCGLEFPPGQGRSNPAASAVRVSDKIRRWHAATSAALELAIAGKPPGELPPLDLSQGTEFQQSVWQAMRQIPCGQTQSYGELARSIGKSGAVRAVGGACGANPIPLFVPCHRVLAANHRLGGFSSGLQWKRALLEREGVIWE